MRIKDATIFVGMYLLQKARFFDFWLPNESNRRRRRIYFLFRPSEGRFFDVDKIEVHDSMDSSMDLGVHMQYVLSIKFHSIFSVFAAEIRRGRMAIFKGPTLTYVLRFFFFHFPPHQRPISTWRWCRA